MKKAKKAITVLSFGKKLLKGAVVAELVCFIGCYLFYRQTNRDPEFWYRDSEFRYNLYISGTPGYEILQAYYTLGQTMDSELKIKEHDLDLWQKQGKCI